MVSQIIDECVLENKARVRLIAGVLQSAEVEQGVVVDAAEASYLVGVSPGEVPSAGSGDAFESNTGELYINRAKSLPGNRGTSF